MSKEAVKSSKYEIDMTTGAILPKMLRFTLPLMASSMLQLLFNAADIIIVGKSGEMGDYYMGAVGSNGALINLLIGFFIGLSVGSNVIAARCFGSKDDEGLSKTVHTSMMIALVSGALLTVVGLLLSRQMLVLMGTPDELIGYSTTYLMIYFLGMIPTTVYNFGSSLLRAIGDTRRPLYYLTIAGVLNVLLNMFTVLVLDLNVAGVAIATVVSQTLSATLVVICLMREKGAIRFEWKKLSVDKSKLGQIVRIGLPAGLQGTLFSLSNVVIQSSINKFGPDVVSGNSAAANLEGFVYVAMNSFYQAVISFVSQNFGQRNYKRIVKSQLIGIACATVVGLVLGLGLTFVGKPLLHIYAQSQSVIDAGEIRFYYVAAPYFLCGIMDSLVGGLRGIGYSFAPMVVSLMGACVFRLVWIWGLFAVNPSAPITAVYISYPISWALTAGVHAICFVVLLKKVKKKYPEAEIKG